MLQVRVARRAALDQREQVLEEAARAVLAGREHKLGDEVAGGERLGGDVQRGGGEGCWWLGLVGGVED
jgi:hypothetical protein